MPRKVYLEPPWKMHAGQHRLVSFPPAEYEFVVRETPQEKVFNIATRWDFPRFLLRSSDIVIPTGLVKSWLERRNRPPPDTVLTYAVDHLVFRREPWVMEVEFASLVAGRHPKHLKRFRWAIERILASPYCKAVLCTSQAARRTLLEDLKCRGFQHKVEVVNYSIPPRSFVKEFRNGKVKLIFVGADALSNSWAAFEYKGGREVLETFAQLRQRFIDLELVVRSRVPPDVKARYERMEGLRIIDEFAPWEELEREYLLADICIMPSHTTIPMTLLEAMGFELPVVTIDSWSNAEYVEDGKTGLVAPRSKRLPYRYADTSQPNFGTAQYDRAMRINDPGVVDELAKRVSMLIEDPELRRCMGKAARWEVEEGKFSLETMNGKLKRIFDEALADGG